MIKSYYWLIYSKSIRHGMCHVIHWYSKANNKYVKDYNSSKESSYIKYLKYLHVKYLYGKVQQ